LLCTPVSTPATGQKTEVFNVSQGATARIQKFSTFRKLRQAEYRCFLRFAGRDGQKTNVFKINWTAAIYNGEQTKEIAGELFISTEERPVKLQEASRQNSGYSKKKK
jgi:hypothetical protein